jgi:hypothetical protein
MKNRWVIIATNIRHNLETYGDDETNKPTTDNGQ